MVATSASPLLQAAAGGGALLFRQLFDAPTGTFTDLLADVRSAEEFEGPDGRIAGSQWIPLPELEARSGEIPTGKPAVVVCHSGSRSALATQQLLKAGRDQVANLRGGLSRWGDEGYPLESATAS
jgi:rhodanese-related sulfurtransferase